MSSTTYRRKRFGTGMLETIMATAMVSISLVAALNSMAFVINSSYRNAENHIATQVAQCLLSEVAALPFEDPENASGALGVEVDETGFTRSMWDDCDDFQGWTSASITYLDGVAIPYALDWTAALSVHYCAESDPALESLVESNLKRITLVLTSPSGHTFEFDTLRARAGTLLSVQAPASSVLSHASVLLTVDGDELGIGTRLHNQQEPD